jgi:elongation factor P hydroxylase
VKLTGSGHWGGWKAQLSPTFEHLQREKRLMPLSTATGEQTQFYDNEQKSQAMQWLLNDDADHWRVSGRYQTSVEQSGNTLGTKREAQRQLNSVSILHQS